MQSAASVIEVVWPAHLANLERERKDRAAAYMRMYRLQKEMRTPGLKKTRAFNTVPKIEGDFNEVLVKGLEKYNVRAFFRGDRTRFFLFNDCSMISSSAHNTIRPFASAVEFVDLVWPFKGDGRIPIAGFKEEAETLSELDQFLRESFPEKFLEYYFENRHEAE